MDQSQSADEDPEGSAREINLENLSGKQYHNEPLLDVSCLFLELPSNVMETLFALLPVSSLSSLSQTCSMMNNLVEEFLRYNCRLRKLSDCKAQFLARNAGFIAQNFHLMIPYERQLIERMQIQLPTEGELSRHDMFRQIDNMEYYIKRMNSIKLFDFPQPEESAQHVEVFLDSHMSRNIVWVKYEGMLFPLRMNYTWHSVHTGMIQVAIRIDNVHAFKRQTFDSDMIKFWMRLPGQRTGEERYVLADRTWWDLVSQTYSTYRDKGLKASIPEVPGEVLVVGIGAQLACLVAPEKPGCPFFWKAVQVVGQKKDNKQTCKDGFKMKWEEVNSKLDGNVKIKLKEVQGQGRRDTCFLMKDVEPLGWAADLIFAFQSEQT